MAPLLMEWRRNERQFRLVLESWKSSIAAAIANELSWIHMMEKLSREAEKLDRAQMTKRIHEVRKETGYGIDPNNFAVDRSGTHVNAEYDPRSKLFLMSLSRFGWFPCYRINYFLPALSALPPGAPLCLELNVLALLARPANQIIDAYASPIFNFKILKEQVLSGAG